jgi:hypothetical protein
MVDIFDMKTSRDAFGVFSHSREEVDSTFGQGSQYTGGLLLFWKNNYFISILASPETEISKQTVMKLAKNIEDAIPADGPLPGILALLPEEALVLESIRYFHHYIWLNSHYFVSNDNILHIDKDTDGVLAKYGKKGKRSILLVLKYPEDEHAKLGYNDFVRHYLPEISGKPVVQIEDGTWTGCRLKDDVLTIVFNAADEGAALKLMERVQKKTDHR